MRVYISYKEYQSLLPICPENRAYTSFVDTQVAVENDTFQQAAREMWLQYSSIPPRGNMVLWAELGISGTYIFYLEDEAHPKPAKPVVSEDVARYLLQKDEAAAMRARLDRLCREVPDFV